MEWGTKIGKIYATKRGTARVRAQYWVKHNGANNFTAGYEGFGMLVTFTQGGKVRVFSTVGEAKAYCEMKDREAVLIEGVIA